MNFDASKLYDRYACHLRIRDKLCGGMPKNPEVIKVWIASTTEHDDAQTTEQEKEALAALQQPTEEKSWNGFPGDTRGGLFVWCRQVKAMFKECASMLRITTTKLGSKQIFQHGFEIKGADLADRIYLGSKEPTGFYEGPIHVMTAQGPRSALKRVDYLEAPDLRFAIWVLRTSASEKRHVGRAELEQMLTFAQENGIGADRSQGHGKFDVIAFEAMAPDAG